MLREAKIPQVSRRVRFKTRAPCPSGVHDWHEVEVTAVYETDDDGSWMRIEAVQMGKHDVWKRLRADVLGKLVSEAYDEYERAMRANR